MQVSTIMHFHEERSHRVRFRKIFCLLQVVHDDTGKARNIMFVLHLTIGSQNSHIRVTSDMFQNFIQRFSAVGGHSRTVGNAFFDKDLLNQRTTVTRVSFSSEFQIHEILHINDYDNDEIDSCWYEGWEYEQMKREIIITAKKMEAGGSLDEKYHCRRGAEERLPSQQKARAQAREDAIFAVLAAQEGMWECTTPNDELISMAYQKVSHQCALNAYVRGVCDEQIALADVVAPRFSPSKRKFSDKFTTIKSRRKRAFLRLPFSSAA